MRVNVRGSARAEGVVTLVRTRKARSGSFAHEYTVGNEKYTHFSEDDFQLLAMGDYVRFEFQVRQARSGYRFVYRAINEGTIELIATASKSGEIQGHVYVLTNKSMPGLCKIGFTTGRSIDRASALSSNTGVPTPFEVARSIPIYGDARLVERTCHLRLEKHRRGKEFFNVSASTAERTVNDCYRELYPGQPAIDGAGLDERLVERKKLRQIKLAELEKDRKRREYEASPDHQWLKSGQVVVVDREYLETPLISYPNFWKRIFTPPPPSWLHVRVVGRRGYRTKGGAPWRVLVAGRSGWNSVSSSYDFFTYRDARAHVDVELQVRVIPNVRIEVEVATELIKNIETIDRTRIVKTNSGYVVAIKDIRDLVFDNADS